MATTTLIDELQQARPESRQAIIALPDSAARDVIRQLAAKPRWDGDLNSKHGRDVLVERGWAARWNGMNFLTQTGYAVVDSLWDLQKICRY